MISKLLMEHHENENAGVIHEHDHDDVRANVMLYY